MKVTRHPRSGTFRRVVTPVTALASAAAMAALLAACSGSEEALTSGEGVGGARAVAGLDGGAAARDHTAPDPDARGTANRTTVRTRAMIRTGTVRIVARDLDASRATIDGLLDRYGGFLDEEETENDDKGRPVSSRVVLRVPEPEFGTVMNALKEIGRARGSSRHSENVTTEVIDVDSRVATTETSLGRLRKFLRQATSVDDMIRLESEIASREAELESLRSQQAYLADQTTMSTITVHLSTPPRPAAPPEKADEAGFLAGLGTGWTALKAFLVGAATVVGALLPFVAALAVVGTPLWLLARSLGRRRVGALAEPEEPVSGPSAGARSR